MLVVRVELHDANDGGAVTEIARAEIWNDATGTVEHGNYCVRLDGVQIEERIEGWPRKRHVWGLVLRALEAAHLKAFETRLALRPRKAKQ